MSGVNALEKIKKEIAAQAKQEEEERDTSESPIWVIEAIWLNGQSDLTAGPYSNVLGEFYDKAQAQAQAPLLFEEWRNENPPSDGWRTNAWHDVALL